MPLKLTIIDSLFISNISNFIYLFILSFQKIEETEVILPQRATADEVQSVKDQVTILYLVVCL